MLRKGTSGINYGNGMQNNTNTLTAAEFHDRIADRDTDTSMHRYGQELELSYESDAGTNRELVEEFTTITIWYATYASNGGEADSLEITVRTGESRARVTVDKADAMAFAANDLTKAQYQDQVLMILTSVLGS